MSVLSLCSSIRQRCRRQINSVGPATTAVFVALAVLLAAAVIYLFLTGGPWEKALRKKLTSGAELHVRQYRQLGIGLGAVALAVASATMLGLARWWTRPAISALDAGTTRRIPQAMRYFYILSLILVVAAGAWHRYPRLTHSLWNDEEMGFRKYVQGVYQVNTAGGLELNRVPWERALFYNETGNNHVWSTLETKAGLTLFQKHSGDPAPAYSESAARIFPFVSGLLSIAALAWLGSCLGFPRLGFFASLLLAFSPWHIRYSVEIRGYSTMHLTLLLGLGCLIQALRTGLWRWWCGFAVGQAICLLASAGTVWVWLSANLLAAAMIAWAGRDRLANCLRLGVANTLSLAPLAALFVPGLLQLSQFLKEKASTTPEINGAWLADLWMHLVSGVPWSASQIPDSSGISVQQLATSTPWAGPMVLWLLPTLTGLGVILMFIKDWRSRIVAGSLIGGAAAALLQNAQVHGPLLPWHVQYLLPLYCLAVIWLASLAPKRLTWLSIAVVLGSIILTQEPRSRMSHVPRQPIREVAQWARNEVAVPTGRAETCLTGTFGTSDRQALSYDPRVRIIQTADDLKNLTTEATQRKLPLRVYYCDRDRAENEDGAIVAELDRMELWEPLTRLPGMERKYSYRIFEWRQTSAKPANSPAAEPPPTPPNL